MNDGFIETELSELIGKTLVSVERAKLIDRYEQDEIIFITTEGIKYRMTHWQDCCESVSIEDINGDLNDLVGEPILTAEVATNEEETKTDSFKYTDDSHTWTFYKFSTREGYVDIRWIGESNGYYSEEVSFGKVIPH